MRLPCLSTPIAERHTRIALPTVAPHSASLAMFGLGLPSSTISGRFWRANATPAGILAP